VRIGSRHTTLEGPKLSASVTDTFVDRVPCARRLRHQLLFHTNISPYPYKPWNCGCSGLLIPEIRYVRLACSAFMGKAIKDEPIRIFLHLVLLARTVEMDAASIRNKPVMIAEWSGPANFFRLPRPHPRLSANGVDQTSLDLFRTRYPPDQITLTGTSAGQKRRRPLTAISA